MQLTYTLLVSSAGIRLFGSDALVRSREEEAGLLYLPYYFGKYLGNFIEIFLFPLVFLLPYYTLVVSVGKFVDYYEMLFVLQLTVYGMCNLAASK